MICIVNISSRSYKYGGHESQLLSLGGEHHLDDQ